MNKTKPFVMKYPYSRILKAAYKIPVLVWRMGWGFLLGRLFIILTTYGRKSGLPRYTALEYNTFNSRMYVYSGYGAHSNWFRNIKANPLVTVQTNKGNFSMRARRVETNGELVDAYDFIERSPIMRMWVKLRGQNVDRQFLIENKELFYLITFDPTEEAAPIPLPTDLWWVNFILAAAILAIVII
jgi:deazaflavin-dependent oxidoreductase (nitroreductase family)